MRLTWYGHACFRVEGAGLSIVTDPYTPGSDSPGGSGLAPIPGDSPDVVVMSSDDDVAHACWQAVPGSPRVVNAMDAIDKPILIGDGVEVRGFKAREGDAHPDEPSPNAMFRFVVDGVALCHMGDIGTALDSAQIDSLRGQVDVLLALAGGGLTIQLSDLDDAIDAIGPRVVVPMHFMIPGLQYSVGPLRDFLEHRQEDRLRRVAGSSIDFGRDSLPANRTTVVLKPLAVTSGRGVVA